MSAPNQSPFDGNPTLGITAGYRPTLNDFNGAALEDDAVNPPDPQTMPCAPVLNTTGYTIVSLGKMVPCANFAVTPGVSPAILSWVTAALNIVSDPFTPSRNGAGDYSITFPANTFPIQGQPKAHLNVQLGNHNYSIGVVSITNGVRVTTTQDGVLTDLPFSVDLF